MDNERHIESETLARAAQLAASKEHLFASVLTRYAELNGFSDADLCVRLNCDGNTLNRLRLCGRPDPDPSAFALDVQRIAERFGLDPSVLSSIVREVDMLGAFRSLRANTPFSSTSGDMLRAARDRDDVQMVLREESVEYNTELSAEETDDDQNGGSG